MLGSQTTSFFGYLYQKAECQILKLICHELNGAFKTITILPPLVALLGDSHHKVKWVINNLHELPVVKHI